VAVGAHAAVEVELPTRPAPVLTRPTRVPRALIERVEREYRHETKRPAEEPVKHELVAAVVDLTSIKPGTLNDDARWLMAPGGGAFDFSGVVEGQPGSFNLKLSARDQAGEPVKFTHLYYVPRSKVRRLDGETFGDGCGKVFELTGAWRKRFAHGIDLYTAGQRYLSTVGGTFLVAAFGEKVLQVAHVTFTDSRYPQLICE
jgi:hypothetical protein